MFTEGLLYSPEGVMGSIIPYTAWWGEIAPVCVAWEHEYIPLLYSISPSLSFAAFYPPPVCCHFVCLCTSVFDGAVDVGTYASFPLPEDDNGSTTNTVFRLFDKVTLRRMRARISRFSNLNDWFRRLFHKPMQTVVRDACKRQALTIISKSKCIIKRFVHLPAWIIGITLLLMHTSNQSESNK